MARSSDVGMADLFPVGLPAVFAAHLLPPARALQSRGLAVAYSGDRARPRGAGFVASWRSLAGAHRRSHPCHLLAVRRLGLLARPLRHHQLGRQLFRRGLCGRGTAAGLDRPYPQPAIATPEPGRRPRVRPSVTVAAASGLCIFVFALFAWPLVGRLLGRPWLQAEIFGIAPDPTVVATLGVLVAADRTLWELLVVPLLWCAISGATLWTMQSPDALLAPIAALLGLVLSFWKTLSRLRQASPA